VPMGFTVMQGLEQEGSGKTHTSIPAAARITKACVAAYELPATPMRHTNRPPKVMVLHSSQSLPLMPNLQASKPFDEHSKLMHKVICTHQPISR